MVFAYKTLFQQPFRVSLRTCRLLACALALALPWSSLHGATLPAPASRSIDFTKDIKPIFTAHCFSCHSGDRPKAGFRLDDGEAALRGGDYHAPAIKPMNSAESPLILFVAGLAPGMKMPQKGDPLSADQIALLRAWIDQGAVWPEEEKKQKELHWSLTPVIRPSVPRRTSDESNHPIDAFIVSKLAENNLVPSPEADRRTLLRRLYFDLAGLPPSTEDVRAFQEDTSPDAYEKVVDKLLRSSHYGERWGRHWLDLVRFAETTGFEVNTPRPNAWPYRDYVIRAFNDDKPYDRFILEQIAGDVLGEDAATGFLVAGPDDLVKSPDPVLTANQRADELHDIVSATGAAFLGLTVGCARCHNHKFDPISQTDYFGMKAVFEGVQHGERTMNSPETAARQKEVAERRQQLAQLDARLIAFEPLAQVGEVDTTRLRAPVHPRQNIERFSPVAAKKLRFTIFKTTDAEPCIDELEVYTAEPAPRNIALAGAGTKARASSVFPNSEIHRLEHINDGIHGNSRSWISNERGKGWVELEFPQVVTIQHILWGRDREQRFADRLAIDYRIEVADESGEWRTIASSVDRQAYQPGGKAPAPANLAGLESQLAEEAKKILAERAALESRIGELTRIPMIYGGRFVAQPGPTHRLHRGDPMEKREVIGPGALEVIPVTFSQAAGEMEAGGPLTEDQRRRLALANWIIDPANPLTARVMVNRIWQYHFAEGLVDTPSDFGANGSRPTHPELLDWLAAEFMEPSTAPGAAPWSMRHIHRLIVTSATYRQASQAREEGLKIDAGSRLLWRYPPRRLEAEPIRDLILALSGRLNLRMGGPGFSFFEPNDNYVRVYTPRQEFGPETWRRMIYGTVVRQRPDGVFGVFDCPDGGQVAPKRTRSTTALQALNLLNSTFIMQQAGFFAERLESEAGADQAAQVRRAFSLAFQREPDRDELEASMSLVREHGLTVFCRALLNANELVYTF
jgi:mono/diheme cytochrome c family protein